MPRYPRVFIPNVPLHIVQRGHDRQPVFLQSSDYTYFLSNLQEKRCELAIRVHAYCLMTNHVHLVITPANNDDSVSKLMRVLAARQTRYINRRLKRTGTLWEGRFKASPIDTDNYLLACYRYVELNPVRAGLVENPADYHWSSFRFNASLVEGSWLDRSATYQALGQSDADRVIAYRALIRSGQSDVELALIRTAVKRNQLTGSSKFQREIVSRSGRLVPARGPGRPVSARARRK